MKTYISEWLNFLEMNPKLVADELGIDLSEVTSWVVGNGIISLDNMMKLSKLLNVSVNTIMEESPREYITRKETKHTIDTQNKDTANKILNYLDSEHIENNIVRIEPMVSRKSLYRIEYTSTKVIEPIKLAKIVNKLKYKKFNRIILMK